MNLAIAWLLLNSALIAAGAMWLFDLRARRQRLEYHLRNILRSRYTHPEEFAEWLSDAESAFPDLAPAGVREGAGIDAGALCDAPPSGWYCSRGKGHSGPCAAVKMPVVTRPVVPNPGEPYAQAERRAYLTERFSPCGPWAGVERRANRGYQPLDSGAMPPPPKPRDIQEIDVAERTYGGVLFRDLTEERKIAACSAWYRLTHGVDLKLTTYLLERGPEFYQAVTGKEQPAIVTAKTADVSEWLDTYHEGPIAGLTLDKFRDSFEERVVSVLVKYNLIQQK